MQDDVESAVAQRFAKSSGLEFGFSAEMGDIHIAVGPRHIAARFANELDHALSSHCKANAGRRPASQHFDERIIPSASANRALSSELVCDPLEDRVVVVVKAAHQPRIDRVVNAQSAHPALEAAQKLERLLPEVVKQTRCVVHHLLHVRILGVQNAQRIGVQAALSLLVENIHVPLKVGDQRLAVLDALFEQPKAVQFKPGADAELRPESGKHPKHVDIDIRPGKSEGFAPKLIELAIAASLRALVPEHRSEIPQSLRGVVREIVLNRGAHDSARVFRTQRELLAIHAVLEGIHFLLDNIRHLSDTPAEKRR